MTQLRGARPVTVGFAIDKVDAEQRQVWGITTAEMPDKQGGIVDLDASINAGAGRADSLWRPHGAGVRGQRPSPRRNLS
jgi:hypothetical protein